MDTDDNFDPAVAMRIRQLYYRTELARLANRTVKKPRNWGNASPEMLTGGLATTQAMREAIGSIEREVA